MCIKNTTFTKIRYCCFLKFMPTTSFAFTFQNVCDIDKFQVSIITIYYKGSIARPVLTSKERSFMDFVLNLLISSAR